MNRNQAYTAAERLDKLIADLMRRHPITTQNGVYWLAFSRTVRTTLDAIDEEAYFKLAQAAPEDAS